MTVSARAHRLAAPRVTERVTLLWLLLGGFLLRFYRLGAGSWWYDESVSAMLAQERLGELIAHTARDIHPPLYYILLHFWGWLMGRGEFTSALFSAGWGLLLIASVATFGRWLGGRGLGLLAAALVALSPFNVWYSQEVRMYTMAATLGVWSLMALWRLLIGARMRRRWQLLWLLSAAAGLYTLYYFAFLLLAEALVVLIWRRRYGIAAAHWRRWWMLALSLLALYSLWIPVALRQALFPPVPPWRSPIPITTALRDSLGALAVGHALESATLLLPLVLLAGLIAGGLWLYARRKGVRPLLIPLAALLTPLLILLLSALTPRSLYHPRYLFPYSPAFYLLMAFAFWEWTRLAWRRAGVVGGSIVGLLLILPLAFLTTQSLTRFWNDPAYAADDLRGGVQRIAQQWRQGDVLLINAGYTYAAFEVYFDGQLAPRARLSGWDGQVNTDALTRLEVGSIGGDPGLGWGQPSSDFYATTPDATIAGLEQIASRAPRLWEFRLYDTVTDPDGIVRAWLDQHALLFEDTQLGGDSNARVQGWYFPPRPDEVPARPAATRFMAPDGSSEWLTLQGVDLTRGSSFRGGDDVDLTLWLQATAAMDPTVRLSLGLFDTSASARQWAVTDEQPFAPLHSLADLSGVQRWPVRLSLPAGLPPGRYELRLKFYRPADGATLPATSEYVSPDQALAAVIEVGATRPGTLIQAGTPLVAAFGSLELLGHSIPPGPWQPGASIPIELVWRARRANPVPLRAFLSSDILEGDDGGMLADSGYPTSLWQAGEVVRDVHYVTVSARATPGEYPLFLRVTENNLSVAWRSGLFQAGELLQLGTLAIKDRERSFTPPTVEQPLDVAFDDVLQLVGLAPPGSRYRPGDTVAMTLYWRAIQRPATRLKLFTHLMGPSGNLVAQRDLEPGDGALPTNGWMEGEYVSTPIEIVIPPDAPSGTYELRVGLYDPGNSARLLPQGAGVNPVERYLSLGAITIEP